MLGAYFGFYEALEDRLPAHTLVLDLKNVIYVDSTGAEALESLVAACRKQRVRLIVAELAAGFGALTCPGPFAPAPAGVRGDGSRALTYTVGDGQLILEFEPSSGDRAKRDALGLLVGFEQPETLIASLYRTDVLIAQTTLDELGNFTLAALEPGAYHLILRSDTREISAPDIHVT